MKSEIKPLWIALAAIGAILLLGVLYKVFLAEPPIPAGVSKEEEMKHKGMSAANYSASYKQQNTSGAPRVGSPGQSGGYGGGYGSGYGGSRPGGYGGSQGGYSGGAPR
jgi:hypothetical protein